MAIRSPPKDWANESLALTITYVYPVPESREIGKDYAKRVMPMKRLLIILPFVVLLWRAVCFAGLLKMV
jgi:hypothetical protein